MSRFEDRVFGLLRGFMALGQQDPALLVAVIRIVEMQEHVDRQILASAHGETFWVWLPWQGGCVDCCADCLGTSVQLVSAAAVHGRSTGLHVACQCQNIRCTLQCDSAPSADGLRGAGHEVGRLP
jgi:hypothetical protein